MMSQDKIHVVSLSILIILLPFTVLVINAAQSDFKGIVSYVHDGDTFDIDSGKKEIRLADIDAPEYGEPKYYEAKEYLSNLINNRTVYLDQSTLNGYSGERLVCVVYIEYDSKNYLNVNKKMLDSGLVELWDHENDFNPETWILVVPKITVQPPVSSVPSSGNGIPGYPLLAIILGLTLYSSILRVWRSSVSRAPRKDHFSNKSLLESSVTDPSTNKNRSH